MKRKTKEQKQLSGTFRVDRDNEKQRLKIGELSELPAAPAWLSEIGQEYFNNLSELLFYAGILESADLELLTILAAELSRYRESYLQMQREGSVIKLPNGYFKQSEHNAICKEAFRNASELAAKFGLTLESREKIGIRKEPKFRYNALMSLQKNDFLDTQFNHLRIQDLTYLARDLAKYIEDRKSGKYYNEADNY